MSTDAGSTAGSALGLPHLHLRTTSSTNDRARALAAAGAPHGTLVTADAQSAGRGRQGRSWSAPAGRALLCSLVIRSPIELLSLAAGVAVADVAGPQARIKWPNDVLINGRKVAGILVEGRPAEGWAVLGIGINVAVRDDDFPAELRGRAGSLALAPTAVTTVLDALLAALGRWLTEPAEAVLGAVRERDALAGRPVRWSEGQGRGAGVDAAGRLLVDTAGGVVALEAGEVHLVGEQETG